MQIGFVFRVNVDIKISAQDAFLKYVSSGTLKAIILKAK